MAQRHSQKCCSLSSAFAVLSLFVLSDANSKCNETELYRLVINRDETDFKFLDCADPRTLLAVTHSEKDVLSSTHQGIYRVNYAMSLRMLSIISLISTFSRKRIVHQKVSEEVGQQHGCLERSLLLFLIWTPIAMRLGYLCLALLEVLISTTVSLVPRYVALVLSSAVSGYLFMV